MCSVLEGVCSVLEGVCSVLEGVCSLLEGRAGNGSNLLEKMVESCLGVLLHVYADFASFSDFVDVPDDTLDSFIASIEFVYRLVFLEALHGTEYTDVLDSVRNCLRIFKSVYESRMSESDFRYQVQPYSAGEVGRPSFTVSHEQLSFLIENGFSVPQIADNKLILSSLCIHSPDKSCFKPVC